MKVYALLCIAVLAFIGTTVQAQDSQESQGLIAALESASGQSLRGNVVITKEDAAVDGKNGGARVQVQVMGMSSGGGNVFTGDLEVFVADGAIAAATTSGLPQVKVYKDGDQKLISQMYSKKPKNFGKATDLLGMAFDFESLIKEVKDAKLVRTKDIDGGKQYRVTLDADAFEKDAAGGGPGDAMRMARNMTQSSILEGVLVVDTNTGGELKKMSLELQYNNPMAGLVKMGGGGGGVQAMQLNINGMKKSKELGHKLTIAFTPGADADKGKTAEAFAAEAVKLLEAE